MTRECFARLWECDIVKAVDDVYNSLPVEFVDRYHVVRQTNNVRAQMLFRKYDAYKEYVRANMFHNGGGTKLMDVHKVVAILMWSMVQVNLIAYDCDVREADGSVPGQVLLAKYAVAFCAALCVLKKSMIAELRQDGRDEEATLLRTKRLDYPRTNKGHDLYVVGKVKALVMCDKVLDGRFNALAWASIFCELERYNMENLRCPAHGGCGRQAGEHQS